jgi:hypothetical protein
MTFGPKRLTFTLGLVNIEACVTIGTNSLRPITSEISTGQVMELRRLSPYFPMRRRVFATTSNSSNLLNGVQGVAGSNPAVPIL